jgi:hypothetical protein
VAQGDISQEQADLYLAYALTDYEKLPIRYRSNTPWDGTLPLLHLQERVKTMKASAIRAEIVEAVSATCSTSTGDLPNTTSSTHFYVEYDTIGGGLSIATYTILKPPRRKKSPPSGSCAAGRYHQPTARQSLSPKHRYIECRPARLRHHQRRSCRPSCGQPSHTVE